jgi:hypothetical protein
MLGARIAPNSLGVILTPENSVVLAHTLAVVGPQNLTHSAQRMAVHELCMS